MSSPFDRFVTNHHKLVAWAPPSERINQLHESACELFFLVEDKSLSKKPIIESLQEAALHAGLSLPEINAILELAEYRVHYRYYTQNSLKIAPGVTMRAGYLTHGDGDKYWVNPYISAKL